MKILVPNTVPVEDAELGGATVVVYDPTTPLPDEHTDAEALVAWGNTPDQLRDAARRLPKLRWVQDLAAGPGATLSAGFAPEVAITSGRSLHDTTVAEHALALALA